MPQNSTSNSISRKETQFPQPSSSDGPSRMQVTLRNHSHDEPSRASSSGRPSQMQVALPNCRSDTATQSKSGRPSQMQVALPGSRSQDSPRSSTSGSPSQMQVVFPGQRDVGSRPSEISRQQPLRPDEPYRSSRTPAVLPSILESRSGRYSQPSRPMVALPSVRGSEQSRYNQPSKDIRRVRAEPAHSVHSSAPSPSYHQFGGREFEPTRVAAQPQAQATRPQEGRTTIVRPGEPHHFGSRTDHERGELICTLCICSNPESHGDAYTMLNSPRGYGIEGKPIDWQEAKKRMLDWHGKMQISHAEEIEAISHVYDKETAQLALNHETMLREDAYNGADIEINVQGNNTNWHNEDGHAKPYLTQGGAKTRYTEGGGYRG